MNDWSAVAHQRLPPLSHTNLLAGQESPCAKGHLPPSTISVFQLFSFSAFQLFPTVSPGRLWLEFRRDLRRGARAAWNHRIVAPRITRWRPSPEIAAAGPVPVHIVGGREHLLLGAWMLVSWFHHSGRRWNVIWHEDGRAPLPDDKLTDWMISVLGVRFVSRAEADQVMQPVLDDYPLLRDMRQRLPLMLKLLDVSVLSEPGRVFLFDPDVLFFQKPGELLDWVDALPDPAGADACWFNQEADEPNYLDAATVKNELGFDLWPRFNSGLGALNTRIVDLDFCEGIMRDYEVMRGTEFWRNWRVEQTLMALCCSRHGRGGLLPPTYQVTSEGRLRTDAVSRHYIGAVRDRFWAEGVNTLKTEIQLPRGLPTKHTKGSEP